LALMGWRETLGGAVSEMNPLPNTTQNAQNPPVTGGPEPERVGFGGYGGFGYGGETLNAPDANRGETLRAALAEVANGLPLSLEELTQAFGAEGEADWLEGYTPHCRPEFLRAFARALAERLERERRAEPETEPAPETPPRPHPLEGLNLPREDWQFIEARTRGRRDRDALLAEYRRRWLAAAAAEPIEFRKANAGRFAANAWLREAGR